MGIGVSSTSSGVGRGVSPFVGLKLGNGEVGWYVGSGARGVGADVSTPVGVGAYVGK